ncbi:hypothetical protein ACFE04_023776 [Oxalis oulophora]
MSIAVAASIGAVEALKDQGICRWNYTLRSLQKKVRSNVESFTQSGNSESGYSNMRIDQEKKKTEEMIVKVMELNSWGPTTINGGAEWRGVANCRNVALSSTNHHFERARDAQEFR